MQCLLCWCWYEPDYAGSLQKIAMAFGGVETPPTMFKGIDVTKNVHRFNSLHASANASRSNNSPVAMVSKYAAPKLCCVASGALTYGHPPAGKEPFVHEEISFGRIRLPAQTVPCHGGDLVIPEKPQRVPCCFDAGMLDVLAQSVCTYILECHLLVVFLGQADTDEQDVPSPDLDVAFVHDRVNVSERYMMPVKGAVFDPFLLGPRGIVNKNSTA